LGAKESLATTYENLASTMKNEFKGWSCWLLSGDEEATKALHLKTSRKIRVYNGTIECRFLRYDMF
jgi:putative N6-adenine-specific DNA methylase